MSEHSIDPHCPVCNRLQGKRYARQLLHDSAVRRLKTAKILNDSVQQTVLERTVQEAKINLDVADGEIARHQRIHTEE